MSNLYDSIQNSVGDSSFFADLRSYVSAGNDFFASGKKHLYSKILSDDEVTALLKTCIESRGYSTNIVFNDKLRIACKIAGVAIPIIPPGLLQKPNSSVLVEVRTPAGEINVGTNVPLIAQMPPMMPPIMQSPIKPHLLADCKDDAAKKALVAEMYRRRNPVYKQNNGIFLYRGGHYDIVTKEELKQDVANFCFTEVEKADNARFADGVVELVLLNPATRPERDLADDGNLIFTSDGYALNLFDLDATPIQVPLGTFFSTYLNVSVSAFASGSSLATPVFDSILAFQYQGNEMVDTSLATLNAWQINGYVFSNYQGMRIIPEFQGVGGCGKSVKGRMYEMAKPVGKTFSVKVEELGGRFTLANTANTELLLLPDMAAKPISDESAATLKIMSGRDAFTTDVKYAERQKIHFKGKIVGFTNHGVVLKTADPALVSRIRVYPFFRSVPLSQQDPNLINKLQLELPAIIVKSLRAFADMVKRGQDFAGGYTINQFMQTVIAPGTPSVVNPVEEYVKSRVVACEGARTFSKDFANDCSLFVSRNGLGAVLNFSDYQGFCRLFATEIKKYFPLAISTKLSPGKGQKSVRCYLNIAIKECN